jgi:hypothetical protein
MPVFYCVVLSCVASGLATADPPVQGVLPKRVKVYQKLILNRNRSYSLQPNPEAHKQVCRVLREEHKLQIFQNSFP